jgi:catechol 2,3-dioxygenase-like lactoylglutathione lyase family enzyme
MMLEETDMTATMRLNHMSILVRDLQRSADFYQRVLRLPEVECLAAKSFIRWFGIGAEQTIHLIEADFGDTHVEIHTHFCITASDFEAMVAHIAGTGTPYRDVAGNAGKVNVRADGVRSIYLQDPDGYWIEMSEEF